MGAPHTMGGYQWLIVSVLKTISYHGSGAIKEIPGELQRRGYKKIFVCSDPDLVKFGVTAKVIGDELDAAGIASRLLLRGFISNPTIQNVKDGVEASPRPPRLTLS